jgi:hypothetical protein
MRARLAKKGRLLYGKSCGTAGQATCAESFACHHIRKGESEVARDLLDFLDAEIAKLRDHDPCGRLVLTIELADRVRRHLESATPPPGEAARVSIPNADR